MQEDLPRLITAAAAAEMLQRAHPDGGKKPAYPSARQRVYHLIRKGAIPPGVAIHFGRQVMLDRAKWITWICAGGAPLPANSPSHRGIVQ